MRSVSSRNIKCAGDSKSSDSGANYYLAITAEMITGTQKTSPETSTDKKLIYALLNLLY